MRIISSAIATVVLLTFGLVGCGDDTNDGDTSADTGSASAADDATSESATGDEAAGDDDTNDAGEAGSDAEADDGADTGDDAASSGDPASDDAGTGSGESADSGESGTDDAATAGGAADCRGAVETFFKFTEAALGVASTSVTNAEVTDLFGAAVESHEATSPAPTDQVWADFGAVLTEYHTAWSELPPDGLALEESDAVEERVDTFAESMVFDNDDYDRDAATIVGEECAAEFAAISGGG